MVTAVVGGVTERRAALVHLVSLHGCTGVNGHAAIVCRHAVVALLARLTTVLVSMIRTSLCGVLVVVDL